MYEHISIIYNYTCLRIFMYVYTYLYISCMNNFLQTLNGRYTYSLLANELKYVEI